MNLVQLVGNLGRDPELKHIGEKNTAVCEFSIATSEYRSGKVHTEWHNCKVFGKTAEAANTYLYKGAKVALIGRLTTRSWEHEGKKYYRVEVIGDKLEFLSPKGERDGASAGVPSNGQQIDETLPDAGNVEDMGGDDGLPF